MALDPKITIAIDKARMYGSEPTEIHEALERAGLDPDKTFLEYARTPLADGRLRGEVNLGDPAEWTT